MYKSIPQSKSQVNLISKDYTLTQVNESSGTLSNIKTSSSNKHKGPIDPNLPPVGGGDLSSTNNSEILKYIDSANNNTEALKLNTTIDNDILGEDSGT